MAQVFLSIGTNINREYNLSSGLTALYKQFGHLKLSSLFESQAVGFDGSPFFNMVVEFPTSMTINELQLTLRDIEIDHGRPADAKKFSPRTLDIDILLYGDLVMSSPVQIPRGEIIHNAFVLWPLSELAGSLLHPVLKESYQNLWQTFDKSTQQLSKVPLIWEQPTES